MLYSLAYWNVLNRPTYQKREKDDMYRCPVRIQTEGKNTLSEDGEFIIEFLQGVSCPEEE